MLRTLLVFLTGTILALPFLAQTPTGISSHADIDVAQRLAGSWAGYLEYRDYSEPPTSQKRVQLPTWLEVTGSGHALAFHYTYDDGPKKVVESRETVTLDAANNSYKVVEGGHPEETFAVSGFSSLKDGLGTLVLLGKGTDNDKPAEFRITLTIRRNLFDWIKETRPAGTNEPFVFRHSLRLVRSTPPASGGK
jgi:hypothetical protein